MADECIARQFSVGSQPTNKLTEANAIQAIMDNLTVQSEQYLSSEERTKGTQ